MPQKLSPRFMLPTVIIVLSVMSVFGWLIGRAFEAEVRKRANQEAEDQVDRVFDGLQTLDTLSSQTVRFAMKVLVRGVTTAVLTEVGSSVEGSKYSAKVTALF